MKRWLWPAVLALAAVFLSGRTSAGTDIARLSPVQVVSVTQTAGQIQIRTDTGDQGAGSNLSTAVENLKHTAAAEIFLDTAEYLLISAECEALLPELMDYLRPSCQVCRQEGEPDFENVAAYLRIHRPEVTLADLRAAPMGFPKLVTKDGRMELVS